MPDYTLEVHVGSTPCPAIYGHMAPYMQLWWWLQVVGGELLEMIGNLAERPTLEYIC